MDVLRYDTSNQRRTGPAQPGLPCHNGTSRDRGQSAEMGSVSRLRREGKLVLVSVFAGDHGLHIQNLVIQGLSHSGLKEQRGASRLDHGVLRRRAQGR